MGPGVEAVQYPDPEESPEGKERVSSDWVHPGVLEHDHRDEREVPGSNATSNSEIVGKVYCEVPARGK